MVHGTVDLAETFIPKEFIKAKAFIQSAEVEGNGEGRFLADSHAVVSDSIVIRVSPFEGVLAEAGIIVLSIQSAIAVSEEGSRTISDTAFDLSLPNVGFQAETGVLNIIGSSIRKIHVADYYTFLLRLIELKAWVADAPIGRILFNSVSVG